MQDTVLMPDTTNSRPDTLKRSPLQKFLDFVTFPIRAFTIFVDDKWGLTSLTSERHYYAAQEVTGPCLDVGCGRNNRFVKVYLKGKGAGIDVFEYEGLTKENIVTDMTHFPFADGSFNTVTFIANINHIPRPLRDAELAEAYRCLKRGGNIVVTMGNKWAEILVHKVAHFYDHHLGQHVDVDSERGMHHDEDFHVSDQEIKERLAKAGFTNFEKKYFLTQWGFNHLFIGWKK